MVVDSSAVTMSSVVEEEETFPAHKSSIALAETGLRGLSRAALSSQPSTIPSSSGSTISSSGALGTFPSASEIGKRNILGPDERLGNGSMMQSVVSPVSNRIILPQAAKANDGLGSAETGNVSEGGVMGGRVFSPSGVPGIQWRPGSSFQNQNEAVCATLTLSHTHTPLFYFIEESEKLSAVVRIVPLMVHYQELWSFTS